jgi:hypothetical protein
MLPNLPQLLQLVHHPTSTVLLLHLNVYGRLSLSRPCVRLHLPRIRKAKKVPSQRLSRALEFRQAHYHRPLSGSPLKSSRLCPDQDPHPRKAVYPGPKICGQSAPLLVSGHQAENSAGSRQDQHLVYMLVPTSLANAHFLGWPLRPKPIHSLLDQSLQLNRPSQSPSRLSRRLGPLCLRPLRDVMLARRVQEIEQP